MLKSFGCIKKIYEILTYLEIWIFFCLDQDYDLTATMLKLQFLTVWPCLQSPLVQVVQKIQVIQVVQVCPGYSGGPGGPGGSVGPGCPGD